MAKPYLKKSLGQHFLKDEQVLGEIANAIGNLSHFKTVLEIGPGMGALTKYLLKQEHPNFYVVELDDRWAAYLEKQFPGLKAKVLHQDFLEMDLRWLQAPAMVVGNFPYNISSQIVFRILENKDLVDEAVGMFQQEVARRICSGPGSKEYGILSVLTQAWYDCAYLFDVPPESFNPPPKVISGVIRLKRKKEKAPLRDEAFFTRLVKTAFNQRRKTLRNSLKEMVREKSMLSSDIFNLRPEQISVDGFARLAEELNPMKP